MRNIITRIYNSYARTISWKYNIIKKSIIVIIVNSDWKKKKKRKEKQYRLKSIEWIRMFRGNSFRTKWVDRRRMFEDNLSSGRGKQDANSRRSPLLLPEWVVARKPFADLSYPCNCNESVLIIPPNHTCIYSQVEPHHIHSCVLIGRNIRKFEFLIRTI